jgi:uncharacterized membrane protein YdcZ (DUF606 family)
MTQISYLLPLLLGITVVAQATINKGMAGHFGLASAVALNAAVFFALSLGIYLIAKYTPALVPEIFRLKSTSGAWLWLYLLPGICGFTLVMGLPWSIELIGPSASFILLIASQVLVGLLIEFMQSGSTLSVAKLLGAGLVLLGSGLIIKS